MIFVMTLKANIYNKMVITNYTRNNCACTVLQYTYMYYILNKNTYKKF